MATEANDLVASRAGIGSADMLVFAVGFVASFAIRFFLRRIERWTLWPFGWYRVTIAPVPLIVWLS